MLIPRLNQRVSPQDGRFCEFKHKIFLKVTRRSPAAPSRDAARTQQSTATAEPWRC
ncbi:hypothetical protein ARTHRO8AJ_160016 [Arthrobacter sp. 8AJ]|nr:hypothetical protein ARTHRO8AJ_160016 [Arthrobacter sp. 8AJ]